MPNQASDNAQTTDKTNVGTQNGSDNSHLNLVSLVKDSGQTPSQTLGRMSQENSQMSLAAHGFPTLDLVNSGPSNGSKDGGAIGGIESAIKDGASHVGSIVATGLKYTSAVGLIDHFAGTNISGAVGDIAQGVANEAVNDPKSLLKDAAIGAVLGAGTVLTGGGLEVGLAMGAGVLAMSELGKNRFNGVSGEVSGAVNDAVGVANSVAQFGKDFGTVAGNGSVSNEDPANAKQGLEKAGGFVAQTLASGAGSLAGAEFAGIVGRAASSAIDSVVKPNQALDSAASSDAAAKTAGVEQVKSASPQADKISPEVQQSIAKNQSMFNAAAEDGKVIPSGKQLYNVRFTKVTKPTQVRSIESAKNGTTESAKPGEYIATRLNADGTPNVEDGVQNSWVVKPAAILKGYQISPVELATTDDMVLPTRIDGKPVHMVKLDKPTTIMTSRGPLTGEAGSYLANYDYDPVTNTPGSDYAIVSEKSYNATYRDVRK